MKGIGSCLRAYNTTNQLAAGLIWLALEPAQQILIQNELGDGVLMWAQLKKLHASNASAPARFLAYDQLLNVKLEEGETLTQLISRVESAQANVQLLRPTAYSLKELDDDLAAMALIRALDSEAYSSFRSSLLLMADCKYQTVKEAFMQEQRNREPRAAEQAVAMKASTGQSSSKKGRNKSKCDFCGRQGHTLPYCHRMKEARESYNDSQGKGKKATANSAQDTAGNPQEAAEFAGNASSLDFTNPHSPLISDAGTDWNTDTGATCHMTPHRHWFNTYKPQVTPIRLANDQVIHSTGIGSVCFQPVVNGKPGKLLEFHRVLHVPDLRSNLLSVLYLTKHQSYTVIITSSKISFK